MLLFFRCFRVVYKAKINPLGIDNDIVNLGAYTFPLLFKQLQVHQEFTVDSLMGFNRSQTLKYFFTLIFFFLSFISVSCSPPCRHDQIQPTTTSPSINKPPVTRNQVLYAKKTRPFFINNQERYKKRKKNTKNLTSRPAPFSVMLPKGFVPPSGSSPCHNMKPDLVAFYCDLSTASKP